MNIKIECEYGYTYCWDGGKPYIKRGVDTCFEFGELCTSVEALDGLTEYKEHVAMMYETSVEDDLYLNDLEMLPTIGEGQTCDHKIAGEDDDGRYNVYLSRCSVEDGEPFNNKVTIERLVDGRWETEREYPAR